MTVTSAPSISKIGDVIARHLQLEGPLLPILHALQHQFGYVPAEAEEPICDALNIAKAELHGVISFYHEFKRQPNGRRIVKICQAEACQAVGAVEQAEGVLDQLGLEWNQTSSDGSVTIEKVYCLGLCANGPAVLVDDKVIARVDDARLKTLISGGDT